MRWCKISLERQNEIDLCVETSLCLQPLLNFKCNMHIQTSGTFRIIYGDRETCWKFLMVLLISFERIFAFSLIYLAVYTYIKLGIVSLNIASSIHFIIFIFIQPKHKFKIHIYRTHQQIVFEINRQLNEVKNLNEALAIFFVFVHFNKI